MLMCVGVREPSVSERDRDGNPSILSYPILGISDSFLINFCEYGQGKSWFQWIRHSLTIGRELYIAFNGPTKYNLPIENSELIDGIFPYFVNFDEFKIYITLTSLR